MAMVDKRKQRKMDLSKVGERGELKPRQEPYWQQLRAGCYLGFRPSKRGGKGTWIGRAYDEDSRKYRVKSLGDFGTLPGNEMFGAAKKEAEKLAELVESGGEVRTKIETVAEACEEYAKTRPEAEARFQRYVYADSIAKVKLDKLRRRHVKEWRERLEAQPALVSRSKKGEPVHRARAASTVNRDVAVFQAALAKILSPGAPNSEAAWQEALKAVANADGRRILYLDRSQCRKLLDKIDVEAAPFVRALCLTTVMARALKTASRRSRVVPLRVGGQISRKNLPSSFTRRAFQTSPSRCRLAEIAIRSGRQIQSND